MVSLSFKKGLCLALILSGYHAAAVAYSSLELWLGGATGVFFLGAVYYRSCYNADYKRFEEHVLIRDAYDEAKLLKTTSFRDCFELYNPNKSTQENSAQIKNIVSKNWQDTFFLKDRIRLIKMDQDWMKRKLEVLNEFKRKLEVKREEWTGNKTKELFVAQLPVVLHEVDQAIKVADLIYDALTHVGNELFQKMASGTILNR